MSRFGCGCAPVVPVYQDQLRPYVGPVYIDDLRSGMRKGPKYQDEMGSWLSAAVSGIANAIGVATGTEAVVAPVTAAVASSSSGGSAPTIPPGTYPTAAQCSANDAAYPSIPANHGSPTNRIYTACHGIDPTIPRVLTLAEMNALQSKANYLFTPTASALVQSTASSLNNATPPVMSARSTASLTGAVTPTVPVIATGSLVPTVPTVTPLPSTVTSIVPLPTTQQLASAVYPPATESGGINPWLLLGGGAIVLVLLMRRGVV